MIRFRLRRPYLLGLVAGSAVITLMVIDAIVRQLNPLVIPIILGVGTLGIGSGFCIGWLVESKVIRKDGSRDGGL